MDIFDDGPFETGDESEKNPDLVPAVPNSYLGESQLQQIFFTASDRNFASMAVAQAFPWTRARVWPSRASWQWWPELPEPTTAELWFSWRKAQKPATSCCRSSLWKGRDWPPLLATIWLCWTSTRTGKRFSQIITTERLWPQLLWSLNKEIKQRSDPLCNRSWQDIVVGAPQYFEKDGEIGGAVYVYINKGGKWDQVRPIRIDGPIDSMFGLAVENLGDINQDGYKGESCGRLSLFSISIAFRRLEGNTNYCPSFIHLYTANISKLHVTPMYRLSVRLCSWSSVWWRWHRKCLYIPWLKNGSQLY